MRTRRRSGAARGMGRVESRVAVRRGPTKGGRVYKCVWMIKFRPELDPDEVR